MDNEKKQLMLSYYQIHRNNLTRQIFKISFIYLFLSITWNSVFLLFSLPYSRANLPILIVCMAIWCGLIIIYRFMDTTSIIMQHIVLLYVVFVITCLYFGSGYTEAWSFFLLLPLIAGLYADKVVLITYSSIGVVMLFIVSVKFPLESKYVIDSIDLSNRILLFFIVATFGYVLLNKLFNLYYRQVNMIEESMETTIEQVVKSFIVSIEAKDQYTFGHSERVSKYAVELAKLLPEFQNDKKLQSLRLSGLLHDIGKINIPESILAKPGPLTVEEYEIIKTHTVVGAKMVEKIIGLGSLKAGVLYHHERWDGKGYPTKSKGTETPLDARILAVTDAFDAMTSSRAYRNSLSFNEAFNVLKEGRGTQFDPHLIDIIDNVQMAWLKVYKDSHNELEEFEQLLEFF
ncbi:MAG TPA: HD-GYP domain-containing protein [Bacilli bacterium]